MWLGPLSYIFKARRVDSTIGQNLQTQEQLMKVDLLLLYSHIFIGASLSEPHIDEFAVYRICLYILLLSISRTSCRKSLPALILRVLASFVNSKTIYQLRTH